MNVWLVFLALHLVGLTGYEILLRRALLHHVNSWVLATIMQTGIAIPMVFALFIAPPDTAVYTGPVIVQIAMAAVLGVLMQAAMVNGLGHLQLGRYTQLFNLRVVFSTILGILFLGEAVVPLQILGGALIFFAAFSVHAGKPGHRPSRSRVRGVAWGITAALTISLINMIEKSVLSSIGYLNFMIPMLLSGTAAMWVALAFRRVKPSVRLFTRPGIIGLMVMRALSAYGFTLALFRGAELSVAAYVSSLGVITSGLMAIVVLKERDNIHFKLVASALAAVGLTFILLANVQL